MKRVITVKLGYTEQVDSEWHVKMKMQMRALAITLLKYWFWISSILERTKNSTKTSNTSFESSGNGLPKFWRLGVWHSYWPATPTLYDKLNFLGEEGMASPWCYHAPVQDFFLSIIKAFKWDIVSLCTIFTFPVNWVQSPKNVLISLPILRAIKLFSLQHRCIIHC